MSKLKLAKNPYKVGDYIHTNASGGYYGRVDSVDGDVVFVNDPRHNSVTPIHWTNVSAATRKQYFDFIKGLQPIPGADVKGNPIGVDDIVKIISGPWTGDQGKVIGKDDGGSLVRVKFTEHNTQPFFPWEIEVIRQAPGGMGAFRPMALPISGQPEPVEKQVERVNSLIKNFHEQNRGKVVWNMSTTQFEMVKPVHREFNEWVNGEQIRIKIDGDILQIGCQTFDTEEIRRLLIRFLKDDESNVNLQGDFAVAYKQGIRWRMKNYISWGSAETLLRELDKYVAKNK